MTLSRRFSVAPMMDWTDRHCRSFHRLMTRHALLYTEMVTTGAVLHGDRERLLGFSPGEQPVALQLGGSDPAALAAAARIGADLGYVEINLNCGCPSDRVQEGRFGACLMGEPALVGDCVAAMKAAVAIPVTVKCRIGIDDQDPEVALWRLADTVAAAGVDALIVHARKAWLKGLSPKENRDVPPLDYALVHRLKRDVPALPVVLNGGLGSLEAALPHLEGLDGVMLGRAAYQDPWRLIRVDSLFHGALDPFETPLDVAHALEPLIAAHLSAGGRLSDVTRHVLGLFQAVPGARRFRRVLSEGAHRPGAGLELWRAALDAVASPGRLDAAA
jgi:tRNA-dihydrouridine synthase A